MMSWTQLSNFGNNKISKTSYFWLFFVPICAKLLSPIKQLSVTLSGTLYEVDLTLPFSWQIFYFSALFVSLGNTIYLVKCPSLVREYTRFQEFMDDGKGARQILTQISVILNAGLDKSDLRIFLGDLVTKASGSLTEAECVKYGDIDANRLDKAFWHARELADTAHPLMRNLCFAFYMVGILLTSYIVLQNALFVVKFTKILDWIGVT